MGDNLFVYNYKNHHSQRKTLCQSIEDMVYSCVV